MAEKKVVKTAVKAKKEETKKVPAKKVATKKVASKKVEPKTVVLKKAEKTDPVKEAFEKWYAQNKEVIMRNHDTKLRLSICWKAAYKKATSKK